MGDVSMVAPVLRKILTENPDAEITLLTQSSFTSIFRGIDRLHIKAVETKNRHKGFLGLLRLFREVSKEGPFDKVLDLHDVLRSRILGWFFQLTGTGTIRINKGRREKQAMLRSKRLHKLMHSTERYARVFTEAGLEYSERPFTYPSISAATLSSGVSQLIYDHAGPFIGLAPFARHRSKTMPATLCENLLNKLTELSYRVFLFGGPENAKEFAEWQRKYPEVIPTTSFNLEDQIALISKMQAMISMDSANMHLAAIQGVPVLSIWGATDPSFGFSGIGTEPESWIISRKHIPCRPCSVFGNKPCSNKNNPFECLTSIEADDIIEKLQKTLDTYQGRG